MKVGIMQPYFMPYIGYFSLISQVDTFIIFDTPQFIRHGWIERNRIIKAPEGWQYIKVPLMKHTQSACINEVMIRNNESWMDKIKAQLTIYRKAPYYNNVMDILETIFEKEYLDIVSLDVRCVQEVCNYLGITTPIQIFSKMGLDIKPTEKADEWALHICNELDNVTEYWNPPGGKNFFDVSKYEKKGIKVCFQQMNLQPYLQGKHKFEIGLSILDMMMFINREQIREYLEDYRLI